MSRGLLKAPRVAVPLFMRRWCDVRTRFIMDTVAPVARRHWLRYLDDTRDPPADRRLPFAVAVRAHVCERGRPCSWRWDVGATVNDIEAAVLAGGSFAAALDSRPPTGAPVDLRTEAGRAALDTVLRARDEPLAVRAADLVPLLLKWFPAAEFNAGVGWSVVLPTGAKSKSIFALGRLLDHLQLLDALRAVEGFDILLSGFQNPTQVGATFHELGTIRWCCGRMLHQGLRLAPSVKNRRGSNGTVDLRWDTTLGSIWVECKDVSLFASSKIRRRADRLGAAVEQLAQHHAWPDDTRLELSCFSLEGNIEQHLRTVVEQAGQARGTLQSSGGIRARLVDRDQPLGADLGQIRTQTVTVGPTAIQIAGPGSEKNTTHVIGWDTDAIYTEQAVRNVKDARRQLPVDQPGLVCLGLQKTPGPLIGRLQSLIVQPAFDLTPFVLVLGDPPHAIWRDGQTFDGRLVASKAD